MDVSLVIPFKNDSPERLENLKAQITYTKSIGFSQIIVIEQQTKSYEQIKNFGIEYFFQDSGHIFNKCIANNFGASKARHNLICFLDTDIIIKKTTYKKVINFYENGFKGVCCPISGRGLTFKRAMKQKFIESKFNFDLQLSVEDMFKYRQEIFLEKKSVTGCFMVTKEFFKYIGGWNEGFEGWGYEDAEFAKRIVMAYGRQQYKVMEDEVFIHLFHPCFSTNSWYTKMADNKNQQLYARIASLEKNILEYIEDELRPLLLKKYDF
jgi:predicted glycosyltransferase involved in capsule biosynthesis